VGYFEQALSALQYLPETHTTREQAIDLRFGLRASFFALGEFRRVLDHLCEAQTLATALDDHRRLGEVSAYLSQYFWHMGDHERALALAQRALTLATALGDFGLQVTAKIYLGAPYYALGDYRQAMACFREVITVLAGQPLSEYFGGVNPPAVISRTWLGMCLAQVGSFAEGSAYGEESVRLAETVNNCLSCILAYLRVGFIYLLKGDLPKAIPALERSLALCQVTNVPVWFFQICAALGAAYAQSGRIDEALSLLAQVVEQTASLSSTLYHVLWLPWLGEAYLLTDHLEDASALGQQALDLSREHKERGQQAWTLRLLAESASHREPPEIGPAEAHYQQALTLAEELGMRPLMAHCHQGLGTLYAMTGQQEQARTELSTALEMYRAMDMTFWLPQTEAALAQVEGR
jgi:tetratricopeptide (TPR) repeat protein